MKRCHRRNDATKFHRHNLQRHQLRLEFLEPRRVMDAAAAEVAPGEDNDVLKPFESTEEFQDYLLTQAVNQWKGMFGTDAWSWWPHPRDYDLVSWLNYDVISHSTANTRFSSNGVKNLQVEGVGEGDVVETDGEFLYVGGHNSTVSILDVRDPSDMKITSQLQMESPVEAIFVNDDRLIVVNGTSSIVALSGLVSDSVSRVVDDWYYYEPQTTISVYDITDRSQPALVSTTEIEGDLIATREVNDLLYVVTSAGMMNPPLDVVCSDDYVGTKEGVRVSATSVETYTVETNCRYETEEEYVGRISETLVENGIPSVTTTMPDGTESTAPLLTAQSIYHGESEPWRFVTTSIFDPSDTPEITTSASILVGSASQVYATAENVYVASVNWNNETETTRISQFTIGEEGSSVEVTASGLVPGRLVDQFAMDEYNGQLRVATTESWGELAENGVYVLEANEGALEIIGSVTGLAPGETIFAARFLGDQAFLVTYERIERIDPLFALDLSDPTNPVVLGELKIPGFSEYLHAIDGDHLLGVGRGDGSWWVEMDPQVSLFDVSDVTDLKVLEQETIDFEGWSWSPAFESHLAVNYMADLGILAVPFTGTLMVQPIEEAGGLSSFTSDLRQVFESIEAAEGEGESVAVPTSGLWLFKIDPSGQDPIYQIGVVSHEFSVLRSIRIGDVLFAVSTDTITSHDLSAPDEELDRLYFGSIAFDDYTSASATKPTTLDVLGNDRVSEGARIISVSEPVHGGTVEISEDGRSIVYTPPAEFESSDGAGSNQRAYSYYDWNTGWPLGSDSFTYVIDSGDGRTDEAAVQLSLYAEMNRDEMIELAKQDLAGRLSISTDEIETLRVSQTVWPDSCLGVYARDQECAQVITPGFLIWLHANDEQYEYHTDNTSVVVLVDDGHQDGIGDVVADYFFAPEGSADNRLDVLANDFPGVVFIRAPEITAVTAPSEGGTVTIGEGGGYLLYTPPEGFSGTETFRYTVDNGDSAEVSVNVWEVDNDFAVDDVAFVDPTGGPAKLYVLANDSLEDDAKIVSVTEGYTGATIEISEDGKYITYTPARALEHGVNRDSFSYSVDTQNGYLVTASVQIELFNDANDDGLAVNDAFRVKLGSVDNRLNVMANDFRGVEFVKAPEITGVTEPSNGGTVTIADGGGWLLYTPPANFTGRDIFRYTVDNGDSAEVWVNVLAELDTGDGTGGNDPDGNDPGGNDPGGDTGDEPLIGTRLAITDEAGNPLSKIQLGDTFYVNLYLKDLREPAAGVYSLYVDLEFNERIAKALHVEASAVYSNGLSGEVKAGEIDELGAYSNSLTRLGDAEYLLVRVAFTAIRCGELEFTTNMADYLPSHGAGIYDVDELIPSEQIEFASLSIDVVNSWHNSRLATDVNNDFHTTPLDALAVINRIHRFGVGAVADFTVTNASGEVSSDEVINYYYDVNEDGYITALDPLNVINALNALDNGLENGMSGQAEGEFFDTTPMTTALTNDLSDADATSPTSTSSLVGLHLNDSSEDSLDASSSGNDPDSSDDRDDSHDAGEAVRVSPVVFDDADDESWVDSGVDFDDLLANCDASSHSIENLDALFGDLGR